MTAESAKKSGIARSKCTPESWQQALDLARLGRFKSHIAATIGVRRETLATWLEDEARAIEFAQAVAVGEELLLATALAGGESSKATMWFLERLHQTRYGAKSRTELTGKNGGAIEIASLTPEERKARIAELLAKRDDADRARGE